MYHSPHNKIRLNHFVSPPKEQDQPESEGSGALFDLALSPSLTQSCFAYVPNLYLVMLCILALRLEFG